MNFSLGNIEAHNLDIFIIIIILKRSNKVWPYFHLNIKSWMIVENLKSWEQEWPIRTKVSEWWQNCHLQVNYYLKESFFH